MRTAGLDRGNSTPISVILPSKQRKEHKMTTHPRHDEIVEAIKAMPLWDDPQTFRQSEISNCYTDDELVETFGWDGEKALTPKQACKAVKERCDLRDSVYGEMDRAEAEGRWEDF